MLNALGVFLGGTHVANGNNGGIPAPIVTVVDPSKCEYWPMSRTV